ncbi:MAG TPA: dienelactone hydrolase family protein [Steroidobacteraceae bacterium]|nr:dienelactone hydrolase family protein [Steroidobacteraceae bacterium]
MLPFIRSSVITACLIGTWGWIAAASAVAQEQQEPAPPTGAEPQPAPVQRDGVTEPAPEVQATVPRYLQWRQAQFVDWLSDGSMLIRTRFGEAEQVHRVQAPLSMREQVSFAPGGISMAMAQPYVNNTLVYLEQQQGGQRARWFMQHMDTHELVPLTDGQHRDGAGLWAHDGRHLAFVSQRVNVTDGEVYEIDTGVPAPVPRLLAGGAGYRWRIFDRSADDHRLLLGRTTSASAGTDAVEVESRTAELYELQTDNGDLSPVGTPAGGLAAGGGANGSATARKQARGRGGKSAAKAHVGFVAAIQVRAARYAPDGHGLVLLTDQSAPGDTGSGPRFEHLVYFDPDNAQWRTLAASPGHDVARFDLSADGHYIAYSIRADGTDRLMLLDQTRKLDLAVSELPPGTIGPFKFDASGQHLGLTVESVRAPGDVYVYDTTTHAVTAWTHSEAGPLDTQSFVLPERVAVPTWDRQAVGRWQQLQSLVYRTPASPADPDARPHPVLIWLSNGAGAPSRSRFDPFVQYLVNDLHFVVVAPRVRPASPGAGDPGEDAVRDVGSLLVWIGLQRELDRSRVALLGEGFGAYVALQALADFGDRLRGAVVAYAPHGSALAHSPAIRRPLLLVQGLDSPGAPPYELEQLRVRLRTEGVDVQTLEAPGEGFGFTHKTYRDAYQASAAGFLDQLLR